MQALLHTPEETAEILSIGRSRVFDLLRKGSLRSVKIGASRRIPDSAITEFIESLSTDGQGI
jgi:excisionase family DNA binding protein